MRNMRITKEAARRYCGGRFRDTVESKPVSWLLNPSMRFNRPRTKNGKISMWARIPLLISKNGPLDRETIVLQLGYPSRKCKTACSDYFYALRAAGVLNYDRARNLWSLGKNFHKWHTELFTEF